MAEKIGIQLSEKGGKIFYGGPFASIAVCLFTDEPTLTINFATRELLSVTFGPYRKVGLLTCCFHMIQNQKDIRFLHCDSLHNHLFHTGESKRLVYLLSLVIGVVMF